MIYKSHDGWREKPGKYHQPNIAREKKFLIPYIKDEWAGAGDMTDIDGRYSISALEPGIYTMMIASRDKIKIIEGVIIEKGKKTKIDFVFNNFLNRQSGCYESSSNQSTFF